MTLEEAINLHDAKASKIIEVPVVVKECHGRNAFRLAYQIQDANKSATPLTMIDYAERIWADKGTQEEIADMLGWSVSKVKDYTRLSEICEEAWSLIVATYVNAEKPKKKSGATKKVANATFSEGMLRLILKLESWQPKHTRISPKQPLRGVSVATLAKRHK